MVLNGFRDANASLERLNVSLRLENSERRRAEAELEAAKNAAEHANQAKSMFLSRMSHELRTPLNAILGFAQLLEMADLGDRDEGDVHRILVAGRHLLGLINQVLDVGRIEAGEMSLSIEAVDMEEIVGSAVDLIRPMAADPGIELRVRTQSGVVALVDRQRVHQVLLNLLSNAIKYNRPGGEVDVRCEVTEEGRVRVDVTDTGQGLDEGQVSQLFVPFDRLGAEDRYDGVEGSGLGLSLAKSLIEAMDGEIGVASEVGVGSTFWFELPVGDAAGSLATLIPPGWSARLEGRSDRPVTVLLIEDNPSNVELVERILTGLSDVRLVSVGRGRQGLETAARLRPDLILLDLHLPDISGQEFLRLLRADETIGSTSVIVLTADATPGRRHDFDESGITAFLTKPIDVDALLRAVRSVLG
jgi:CheY-like chemotaxis protein